MLGAESFAHYPQTSAVMQSESDYSMRFVLIRNMDFLQCDGDIEYVGRPCWCEELRYMFLRASELFSVLFSFSYCPRLRTQSAEWFSFVSLG